MKRQSYCYVPCKAAPFRSVLELVLSSFLECRRSGAEGRLAMQLNKVRKLA